jgi:serine/threonine protein kinase
MTTSSTSLSALANGTELNGYVITGLIGQGGFGVVYVARDTVTRRTVAIKEFAVRAATSRRARRTAPALTPPV